MHASALRQSPRRPQGAGHPGLAANLGSRATADRARPTARRGPSAWPGTRTARQPPTKSFSAPKPPSGNPADGRRTRARRCKPTPASTSRGHGAEGWRSASTIPSRFWRRTSGSVSPPGYSQWLMAYAMARLYFTAADDPDAWWVDGAALYMTGAAGPPATRHDSGALQPRRGLHARRPRPPTGGAGR